MISLIGKFVGGALVGVYFGLSLYACIPTRIILGEQGLHELASVRGRGGGAERIGVASGFPALALGVFGEESLRAEQPLYSSQKYPRDRCCRWCRRVSGAFLDTISNPRSKIFLVGSRWRYRLPAIDSLPERGPLDSHIPMTPDAPEDWRRFEAESIPTKESTPHLDTFLEALRQATPDKPLTLLDVGCGGGRLSRRMQGQGFSVLGVDISPAAIRAARSLATPADAADHWLRFEEADFAADQSPRLDAGPFDIVVCQLVISIIGAPRHRVNLLRHVYDNLRPGGWLAVSASGVSDTINAGYARLYAEDVHLTGEYHSYYSRDVRGEVLYMTHHFTADELVGLLEAAGFGEISVTSERETSSRRPDEAAYFLYATCRASR